MIFVTVGTHEQQFNRLVQFMDEWAKDHVEDVVIQYGYSTYEPKNCHAASLFSFSEMNRYVEKARIVITHGGPSSFIMPLQIGKIPIVVPRRKEFEEHVNNHQVDFSHIVEDKYNNIIVIDNIRELEDVLENYDELVRSKSSLHNNNNDCFCKQFDKLVQQLLHSKRRHK